MRGPKIQTGFRQYDIEMLCMKSHYINDTQIIKVEFNPVTNFSVEVRRLVKLNSNKS